MRMRWPNGSPESLKLSYGSGGAWRPAVRLYLSSFRMGDHPEHLVALVGGDGRRGVVIANAMDDAPSEVRRAGVERELAALARMCPRV